MLSLLAALALSQYHCNVVNGCVDPPYSICTQFVMCDVGSCAPGRFLEGVSDAGVICDFPPGTPAGACSSGQFVTATTDAGVTCATPSVPAFSVAPSTPSRSLNSTFQPSSTKATFVSYSVSMSCALTLTGGQQSTIQLLSDSSGTPSTIRASAANGNSGTLVVGIAITNAQTIQLSYVVPAGDNVRLSSSTSGTACTLSIVSQVEVTLG